MAPDTVTSDIVESEDAFTATTKPQAMCAMDVATQTPSPHMWTSIATPYHHATYHLSSRLERREEEICAKQRRSVM
jgi:hypothetical protein